MEKAPPPDPVCPICKKTSHLVRPVNAQVEFWECEGNHMFVADRKPPPRQTAAAASAAAGEVPAANPEAKTS